MPARLTDAEMLQYRSTVYGVASTVGHIPRMHMGRHRWTAGMEAAEEAARSGRAGMLQLPPEALEAGQRITSAGSGTQFKTWSTTKALCMPKGPKCLA